MNFLYIYRILYCVLIIYGVQFIIIMAADEVPFNSNYYQMFGGDHLTILDQGKEVQLLIDHSTGSGFSSKNSFGSGYFAINMKMPMKNSTGITTTFYLTSIPVRHRKKMINDNMNHDEFDYEFIGGIGMPYKIRTNVYVNDNGGREQEFQLWFNPTENFHSYEILWNQHQIVFFVDKTPIRVFENKKKIGVNYPSNKMHLEASIWNPVDWLGSVNWKQGPFEAHYRSFAIDGCLYQSSDPQKCYSASRSYYWNTERFWKLSADEVEKLKNVRKQYMVYDYCQDKSRHFPECSTSDI